MQHDVTEAGHPGRPRVARTVTLLDLVGELCDAGASDREVVAIVLELVATQRVRLIGQVVESDLRDG